MSGETAYTVFSAIMVGCVVVAIMTLFYEILAHAIRRQRQRKFKKWTDDKPL